MVDITPEANIFGIFRNLNYKTWYALGEFVDNSLASWEKWDAKLTGIARPEKVKVEIEIDGSGPNPYIEIRDNSTGINILDFPRAFKVASIPDDVSSLNEFGMGMKTAGFWFANSWSVRTSFAGEPIERTMKFDLKHILSSQATVIEPTSREVFANSHYTTVRLNELNQIPKGMTIKKVREHLTGMYRQFLRDGVLELYLNGENLTFEEVDILKAPKVRSDSSEIIEWKKQINFTLAEGRNITGFVGIRAVGNTTHAGLALLRKRRLIEGSADDTWRPLEIFKNSNSFRYQRIFGELHLTNFKVTHTKDAIKWNEGEKESFLESLKKELESEPLNLLYQADNHRTRVAPPSRTTLVDAMSAVSDTLGVILVDAIDRIDDSQSSIEAVIPESIERPSVEFSEKEIRVRTENQGNWTVRLSGFSDPAVSDFFQIASSESSRSAENDVKVQVNLAHPFAIQYIGPDQSGLELLLSFTACLSVSLAVGKRLGARSQHIIDYLNEILRMGENN